MQPQIHYFCPLRKLIFLNDLQNLGILGKTKNKKETFFLASSFHIFALNRFAMLHIFYEQLTPPSAILLFCRRLMKYH